MFSFCNLNLYMGKGSVKTPFFICIYRNIVLYLYSNQITKIMKNQKIKLVVFNGHTLGYIMPNQPNYLCFLHTSVLKGSSFGIHQSNCLINKNDNVRLATEKDFQDFKVCFNGYKKDPNYLYN